MAGHEGRKGDMSPAAGAAMRAVLAEMGKEGGDAAAGVGLCRKGRQRLRSTRPPARQVIGLAWLGGHTCLVLSSK